MMDRDMSHTVISYYLLLLQYTFFFSHDVHMTSWSDVKLCQEPESTHLYFIPLIIAWRTRPQNQVNK